MFASAVSVSVCPSLQGIKGANLSFYGVESCFIFVHTINIRHKESDYLLRVNLKEQATDSL